LDLTSLFFGFMKEKFLPKNLFPESKTLETVGDVLQGERRSVEGGGVENLVGQVSLPRLIQIRQGKGGGGLLPCDVAYSLPLACELFRQL
jgi:hypothetical protein